MMLNFGAILQLKVFSIKLILKSDRQRLIKGWSIVKQVTELKLFNLFHNNETLKTNLNFIWNL